VSVLIRVMCISFQYTLHRNKDTHKYVYLDVFSGHLIHSNHTATGTNTVFLYSLVRMPFHTKGGLDTYHCLSVNVSRQLLIYVDDVNMFGESVNIIKKTEESAAVVNKK